MTVTAKTFQLICLKCGNENVNVYCTNSGIYGRCYYLECLDCGNQEEA